MIVRIEHRHFRPCSQLVSKHWKPAAGQQIGGAVHGIVSITYGIELYPFPLIGQYQVGLKKVRSKVWIGASSKLLAVGAAVGIGIVHFAIGTTERKWRARHAS